MAAGHPVPVDGLLGDVEGAVGQGAAASDSFFSAVAVIAVSVPDDWSVLHHEARLGGPGAKVGWRLAVVPGWGEPVDDGCGSIRAHRTSLSGSPGPTSH
jgi:hypothetical protein